MQPFGEGLVTVVLPQLRRGENSLLLWNCMDLSQPVHTLVGHNDVVLEFQWRSRVVEGACAAYTDLTLLLHSLLHCTCRTGPGCMKSG